MRSIGHLRFRSALDRLDEDGVLDDVILISAASLRILGIRVYTYFIDLLVRNSYYIEKSEELNFSPDYDLAPIPYTLGGFPLRLGTVEGDTCSFRHLVEPYNIYTEVKFEVSNQVKLIKIRPHDYVRKDSEEAIERMIHRYDQAYWQDFYSHHKQIEAIDLGLSRARLTFGPNKVLELEDKEPIQ